MKNLHATAALFAALLGAPAAFAQDGGKMANSKTTAQASKVNDGKMASADRMADCKMSKGKKGKDKMAADAKMCHSNSKM